MPLCICYLSMYLECCLQIKTPKYTPVEKRYIVNTNKLKTQSSLVKWNHLI